MLWAQGGLVGLEGLGVLVGCPGGARAPGGIMTGEVRRRQLGQEGIAVPAVESRPPRPPPSRGLPSCHPAAARWLPGHPGKAQPSQIEKERAGCRDSPVKMEHCLELAFYHRLIL